MISLSLIVIAIHCSLFTLRLSYLIKSGLFSGNGSIPVVALPGMLFCMFAHTLLWLALILLLVFISKGLARAFVLDRGQQFYCGLSIWLIAIVGIHMMNIVYFPRSVFTEIFASIINPQLAHAIGISCVFLLGVSSIIALLSWLRLSFRTRFWVYVTPILLLLALLHNTLLDQPVNARAISSRQQPNILIIGIDSLRADAISQNQQVKMPHLWNFLQHSTYFTHAVTPLGRTFPAWVSILTGQYPLHNGARFDLIPMQYLMLQQGMARQLQQQGYQTVYATDEKRFSPIDQSFGFDKLIGPGIGINDFFIGLFNDFPLSNLVVNTPIGRWLFPYNYDNRADHVTYYPGTFSRELTRFIAKPRAKPLFMAIHLCLPHFPYVWANSADDIFTAKSSQQLLRAFLIAAQQADQQFAMILKALKQNHALDNTLVVVLSDHGESLGLAGDRLTDAKNYIPPNNHLSHGPWYLQHQGKDLATSFGHGNDVLSPSQNTVLLAMRIYGRHPHPASLQTFTASLLDIKPTIFAYLQLPIQQSDGESLLPYLINPTTPAPAARALFAETGFMPKGLNTIQPVLNTLVQLGINYYEVNPETGYVSLQSKRLPELIREKQRAVYYKQWLLGIYSEDNQKLPVLVNLTTQQWTDDLATTFAKNSPVKQMMQELRQFYGKSLTG